MQLTLKVKVLLLLSIVILIQCVAVTGKSSLTSDAFGTSAIPDTDSMSQGIIKWVDFNATRDAMKKAMELDIKSQSGDIKLNWIELLAFVAAKYGNNFNRYKADELERLAKQLLAGESISTLSSDLTHYNFYIEAYTAVLGGFLGEYEREVPDGCGGKRWERIYGLKVFSPIAKDFSYSHHDDFGNDRAYGFSRIHLGNDLLGQTGTPIIAVEGGVVEALRWNQYGGWRIGIRSHDGKRYYYYAHLRKDSPYNKNIKIGSSVLSGDVIGYMGRTGYSIVENVNNINRTHLHFGMQLIFDESQKECKNEIWINVYEIVRLLDTFRSQVKKDPLTKDYNRIYSIR